MKILLKGYYGFGNFGDDILMITSFKMIETLCPNSTLYIFSNFNTNLRGFDRQADYNHYIYRLLGSRPELIDWTYRGKMDLLVDGGGGVYFDSDEGPWWLAGRNWLLMRFGIANLYLLDRVLRRLTFRPKRLTHQRRIGLGLGIGRYTAGSRLFYDHMVELGTYDALYVRDDVSLKLLQDFKLQVKKRVITDMAFLAQYWLPKEVTVSFDKTFRGNIGIVLMDWQVDSEEFFREAMRFAEESREKEYQVTFFSFDENHDRQYIRFFREYEHFVLWQPNAMSLPDFLQVLARQDVLITARAHGAIIGAQLGAVPVCLGRTEKLRIVAGMFPSLDLLIKEPIRREDLHACVDTIRKDYRRYLRGLVQDNAMNRAKASEAVRAFRDLI